MIWTGTAYACNANLISSFDKQNVSVINDDLRDSCAESGKALSQSKTNAAGSSSGNVGIGTVNYVPEYIGVGTLGPSNIVAVLGNVGIGSLHPGATLDTVGTDRMTGFTLTGNGVSSGYILTTNGVGVGTWMPPTGPGGSSPQLQYNNSGSFGGIGSGGTDGTNIGIGTVSFKNTLNIVGSVGIGTTSYSQYVTQAIVGSGLVSQANVGVGTWRAGHLLDLYSSGTTAFSPADLGVVLTDKEATPRKAILSFGNNGDVDVGSLSDHQLFLVSDNGSGVCIGLGPSANKNLIISVDGTCRGGTNVTGSSLAIVGNQFNFGMGGNTLGTNNSSFNGSIFVGNASISASAPTNGAIFTGNVSIGTTANTQTLDVKGSVKSSSGFIVGGNVGISTMGTVCTITDIEGGLIHSATCT